MLSKLTRRFFTTTCSLVEKFKVASPKVAAASCLFVASSTLVANAQNTSPGFVSSGFESPIYDRSPFYGYRSLNSGWSFVNMAGIRRNGSLGVNAPEGAQTAFLQGTGGGTQASFSQNITLSAGTYVVTFQAAQRSVGVTSPIAVPIQVKVDGSPIGGPILPTSTSFTSYSTNSFQISNGSVPHNISFGTDSGNGFAMSLIDSIAIGLPLTAPNPLAPPAPVNVTATAYASERQPDFHPELGYPGGIPKNSYGANVVQWDKSATPYSGIVIYVVERFNSLPGGTNTTFPLAVTRSTRLADYDVVAGITYQYRVSARNFDTGATSASSPLVSVVGLGDRKPLLTEFPAVPGPTFRLGWYYVFGAIRYDVYRVGNPNPVATYRGVGDLYRGGHIADPPFNINDLYESFQPLGTYYVKAIFADGINADSNLYTSSGAFGQLQSPPKTASSTAPSTQDS